MKVFEAVPWIAENEKPEFNRILNVVGDYFNKEENFLIPKYCQTEFDPIASKILSMDVLLISITILILVL